MAEELISKLERFSSGWQIFADRASGDWMLLFAVLLAVCWSGWVSEWKVDYLEIAIGGIIGYVAREAKQ